MTLSTQKPEAFPKAHRGRVPNLERLVVTLDAHDVVITDTGGANGGYGAQLLATLPAEHCMILGCVCDLDITGDGTDITSDAAVDVAVGTTDEDTDATLDSTEADIIAKSDEDLTSDTAEVAIANAAAVKVGASQAIYLNFGVPNADISDDGVITVQGTVEITYVRLGANA